MIKSLKVFFPLALLAVFTIIINEVNAEQVRSAFKNKPTKTQLNAALFRLVKGYGNPARVRELLNQGADPNAKDNYDRTVLMKAVGNKTGSRGKLTIIKMLVSVRADVNARDQMGMTALMRSMIRGDETVVKILKEAGAKLAKADQVTVTKKRSEIAAKKARQAEMYKAAERFRKTKSTTNK